MKNDVLQKFKDWWMQHRLFMPPESDSLSHVADTHGTVLFRRESFQVELFNVRPNSIIKPHIHPNVDSFEVFISGDIEFMCDGIWYSQDILGASIRVSPNSYHGGKFGKRGGCFLSIQHWLNNIDPKFVGDDWGDAAGNSSYMESAQNGVDK